MNVKIKLKKGDEVIVNAGKDKGKIGKITLVKPQDNKAIVSGINKVKKHTKPDNNQAGGIVDKEMPINISNLSFYDSTLKKGVRLAEEFKNNIKSKLMEKYQYKNIHQIPKIKKVVLNMGIGDAKDDAKVLDKAQDELSLITGQKAIKTKAKKAIAGFKIREGMGLGVSVTLRNEIMYEFLDRLINIAIPRIRDFRGLNPRSFDGNGNYTLGIKEQIIFPEIEIDKVNRISGMDITLVSSANTDMECKALLQEFGMPFKK